MISIHEGWRSEMGRQAQKQASEALKGILPAKALSGTDLPLTALNKPPHSQQSTFQPKLSFLMDEVGRK
jgi:hypothetical protein